MVLLPICMVGFLLVSSILSQFTAQTLASAAVTLENAAGALSTDAVRFTDIALQIGRDPLLTPYNLRTAGYRQMEAIERLSLYTANFAQAMRLGIYVPEDQNVYTDSGLYSLETFAGYSYPLQEMQLQDLQQALETCRGFSALLNCFSSHTGESFALWMMPIKQDGSSIATCIALIPMEYYYGHFMGMELIHQVYVCSPAGEMLLYAGNDERLDPNVFSAAKLARNRQDIGVNGRQYHIIAIDTQHAFWKILCAIPYAQFAQHLFYEGRGFLFGLLGVSALCIVIGIFFAYRAYIPIARINQALEADASSNAVYHHTNELMRIYGTLQNVFALNEELEQKLRQTQPHVMHSVLSDLLGGRNPRDEESCKAWLKKGGVAFGRAYFCVLIAESASRAEVEIVNQLACTDANFTVYAANVTPVGSITLVLNLDLPSEDMIFSYALNLIAAFRNACGGELTIGASSIYHSCGNTSNAFTDALRALSIARNAPYHFAFAREARSETAAQVLQFAALKERLMQSVACGEKADWQLALENAIAFMRENRGLTAHKHMCSALLFDVMRLASESQMENCDRYLNALAGCHSLEEAQDAILETAHALYGVRERIRQEEGNARRAEMCAFVQTHLGDAGLNLSMLAEAFHLSETRMSRLFKQYVGETFMDYVSRLRMERVCRLLRETNLPVGEIIHQAGYVDVPNFSRKFRQTMGVTPSQYRNAQLDGSATGVSQEKDAKFY